MHITYVKYSGQQINQDTVLWYNVGFKRLLNEYFNTGDICVYESTLRLIGEASGGYYLNIDLPVDDNVVAQLRAANSTILLRGSNYLHEEMNWGYFADWLEALKLPVIVCGVGAQAEIERDIVLPPENLRVWKLLSEHCTTIGVRGSFSAHTLHINGIHNIEIVGCPSVFRARKRDLTLRHAPGGPRRITFSVRREVDHMYSVDPEAFTATQKRVIAKLALCSDLYLSCHGEPEEKAFFFRSPEHIRTATERLVADGWFDEKTGHLIKELYRSRLYYVGAPGEYDVYAPQFDAALGYRVHAVLPALAVGVPGALFSYDTRSRELAETFDLPIYTAEQFEKMPLSDAVAPWRFEKFETLFAERYDRMKMFFEKNGVSTRM